MSNTTLSKLSLLDIKEYVKNIENIELKFRNKLDINEDIRFGFEIEFSNAIFDTVKKHIQYDIEKGIVKKNSGKYKQWTVVEEASVHRYMGNIMLGGEIVSPILTNTEENWKKVYYVCQILKKCEAKIKNCGGHIHFDKNCFDNDDDFYNSLFIVWCYYEKIINKFGYGDLKHKRLNSLIYSKNIQNILKKIDITDKNNLLLIENILKIKKHSIALRKETGTIELRYHNGSINPITWQNNFNFDYNLLKNIKNFDIEGIKKNLDKGNDELKDLLVLTDTIFDNDLDKMYFLKSYFNSTKYDKKILKRNSYN